MILKAGNLQEYELKKKGQEASMAEQTQSGNCWSN